MGAVVSNKPSSAHLEPNTKYWVFVWAGRSTTNGTVDVTTNTETAAAGWSIADSMLQKAQGTGVWQSDAAYFPMSMKIEGTTNPAVNVSISDVTVTEGVELTADFVVSLSRATSGVVTVDFTTGDASDTADPANDYFEDDGTLTFQPGETQKTISILVEDDAVAEGDETFDVVLSNLKGATLADATGTATIVNADPLTVSISNATATEGVDETIDFTVSLNRATNRKITVNVLFSSDSAIFSDITDPADPVVFEPGETTKTYSFGVVDDMVNEPSETFTVVLQSPLSADLLIIGAPGTGTILNTETLEASFKNVPQDHDGSNTFTFQVHFTNDVSITPAAMRDHAFTVTNGDATAAARINSRDDRWLITVDPDGDDAVTITLPGNRACGTQGAICTDEDNPVQLGNSPSATVARMSGTPLTASFSNVPNEHTGADFTFDLAFTDELPAGFEKIKAAFRCERRQHQPREPQDEGQRLGLESQGPASRHWRADDHASGNRAVQLAGRDLHR